jgi:hypothetical protein
VAWDCADGSDGRIVDVALKIQAGSLEDHPRTAEAARELYAPERAMRRRAQTEAMVGLFKLHSEFAMESEPGHMDYALAAIVADAVELARRFGWEPHRAPIAPKLRTLVYRRDGYACVECGGDDVTQLTLDHRVPVSRGGGDDVENLRTLCRRCNSRKGAKV